LYQSEHSSSSQRKNPQSLLVCMHLQQMVTTSSIVDQIREFMNNIPWTTSICSTCALTARCSMRSTGKPSSSTRIPLVAHTQEGRCGRGQASPNRRSRRHRAR
jgi:hypothetical protein